MPKYVLYILSNLPMEFSTEWGMVKVSGLNFKACKHLQWLNKLIRTNSSEKFKDIIPGDRDASLAAAEFLVP